MNVRDPQFTARLEQALTILATQPTRSLAYLEHRFDLQTGALQEWLAEFNGGEKALRFDRIHAVKREIGAISESKAPAKTAATASTSSVKPEIDCAAVQPTSRADHVDDGKRPWATSERRPWVKSYLKWRPVLELLADGKAAAAKAALTQEGDQTEAFYMFCNMWLGERRAAPTKVRAFLAWGDVRCGALAEEPRPAAKPPATKVAVAPAVADSDADPRTACRTKAIATLVKTNVKPRFAQAKVDAAIAKLNGADVDVDELVKLAMQEPAIASSPPPSAPIEKATSRTQLVDVCGANFKIEVTVRLVPLSEEPR